MAGARADSVTQDQRGIVHSLASNNNFDDAMKQLKEFGLQEYFLYPEIHWSAKSGSIANIAKNLNLGLDAFLFIDDQPFERDEVKSAHPEITCVAADDYRKLPADKALMPRFVTEDSKRRRRIYMDDRSRKQDAAEFKGPRGKFLSSLSIVITISEAREEDLKRAEELTVRTNQLNATGQTYSYDELKSFLQSPDHGLFVCEMQDRYGHYGKIGLALVETAEPCWHIKLLLMSCRVMSLGVGTVLLTHILRSAQRAGKRVTADFRHTGRNRMMYVTYKFAGFKEIEKLDDQLVVMENDLTTVQDYPSYAEVHVQDNGQEVKIVCSR